MNKTFGLIGGDRRQTELARLLTEDGYSVQTCGVSGVRSTSLNAAAAADVVILPLPLCRGTGVLNCEETPLPTADLFRYFHPEQILLAGQVQNAQRQEAEEYGLTLEDYFQREELTVANAAITAEAAVQTAMEHLDQTILGLNALVLGFGRIGKLLSFRLHGFGARVSATARKPGDLAWIRAYGFQPLSTGALDGHLSDFSLVFNTVPSRVLDEPLLRQLPRDCLCVDLASTPGIDSAAAAELGIQTLWARSLPGRLAPRSAAAVIRDAVYYILEERGDPL